VTRKVPLSPGQHSAYSMGRVLILFDTWATQETIPLDLERAMLIDFASQYPRPFVKLVPSLERVLRAYSQHQSDLAELFAVRQLHVLSERFTETIAGLLARELLSETQIAGATAGTHFRVTELGTTAVRQFTAGLSLTFRALDEVFCVAWKGRNSAALADAIRGALPAEARKIAELSVPFPTWFAEE
jgi:hypothetical protein